MFPRSGGEKVYLEAVYTKPKYLVTVLFAFNAIILGFNASSCIVGPSLKVTAAVLTSNTTRIGLRTKVGRHFPPAPACVQG